MHHSYIFKFIYVLSSVILEYKIELRKYTFFLPLTILKNRYILSKHPARNSDSN